MSDTAKPSRREQSHKRILDAAARALGRGGYAGVGVAEVMREAGLTHGGFYAHFDSRDALLAEALDYAGGKSAERLRERMRAWLEAGASPLRALVEEYLAASHVESLEQSCPVAALASDMPRAAPALRDAGARRVRALVAAVEQMLPPGTGHAATADTAAVIASTLVGAVQLARTLGTEQGGAAVLEACRAALLDQYDHAGRPA